MLMKYLILEQSQKYAQLIFCRCFNQSKNILGKKSQENNQILRQIKTNFIASLSGGCASLLFDYWVPKTPDYSTINQLECHLTVFYSHQIVPSFVVLYLNMYRCSVNAQQIFFPHSIHRRSVDPQCSAVAQLAFINNPELRPLGTGIVDF